MIKIKVNNQEHQFPTSWDDLSFRQYIDIWKEMENGADHLKLISIMASVELTPSMTIIGIDQLLMAAGFIYQPSKFEESYTMIGPYKIPMNSKEGWDIRFESLGQFEDMRAVFNKVKDSLLDHTIQYSRYVAIYLQKVRDGEYDPLKVDSMEESVQDYPAGQVIALGGFFFGKLYASLRGIKKDFLNTPPSLKKSRPATKNSKRRSASTPRSPKSRRR